MSVQTSASKNHQGLTDSQVIESRNRNGANLLTPPKRTSLWKLYLEKYRDPIIQILLVAALFSLILGFIQNQFLETIGIILAVIIATTVGFFFERDAAKKFDVLTAMNEDQLVKVRRNGRVVEVPRKDIVVGDIILIEVGDEVPADGKLIDAVNLQIDESSLTGEPITTKSLLTSETAQEASEGAYPEDVVLRSTMVMNGHAEAVVTAVGDGTEIGKVAKQSSETTSTPTPLNMQLNKLAGVITKVGTIIAVSAFVIFLLHDILHNPTWKGDDYFAMVQIVLKYFMMAVTLIVMVVPEGLPMAVTLSLALNMRRMLKSNNLVRKLHASETMGAVTVICTDKTGTLTQNRMTVQHLVPASAFETGKEGAHSTTDDDRMMQVAIATNTTAELDGEQPIGNPTEGALLMWLKKNGHDYSDIRKKYVVKNQIPFSTERKFMATAVEVDGKAYTFVKGAPEMVLQMCHITDYERESVEVQLLEFQQKAMRTLAFAYIEGNYCEENGLLSTYRAGAPIESSDLSSLQFTFQAVAGISDPVREDVPEAVNQCRKAGIEVKIVTGDTSATAIEIARQIGIWPEETTDRDTRLWHITGADFAALSDEEAYERVQELRVMSRARPTDKQRLVGLLQKHEEVVAVTGDGTNDAPALNHAHVGLSLGSGTSVAKEASDITLLDDSFKSIANAVMWGRSLYKNIQRFLFFQLVVNLSALLVVLGGSVIGTEIPLTVTQILWVNIIMDTFAALALASLPPSREVMKEKPRKQTDFIINKTMGRTMVFWALVFFAVMITFMLWSIDEQSTNNPLIYNQTMFFTIFVMLHFWNLFNAKCLGSHHSTFRHLWSDRGLLLVLLMIFAGQWLIVTFGGKMFRTVPLSAMDWIYIIVATSAVMWLGELGRGISSLMKKQNGKNP